MESRANRQRGFTLIELLVVVAIVGVLLAVSLPAVQQAREAARKLSCRRNLQQLTLALHNYVDAHSILPAGQFFCKSGNCSTPAMLAPGWGWSASVLPFIDQANLGDRFDYSLPLSAAANREMLAIPLTIFQCPSDVTRQPTVPPSGNAASGDRIATSNYCGNGGSFGFSFEVPWIANNEKVTNGVFGRNSAYSLDDIPDGLSNTIMLGEVIHYNFPWDPALYGNWNPSSGSACCTLTLVRQGAWSMNPGKSGSQTQQRESFSSLHPGGANFAMCDGSVRFISESIDTTSRGPNAGGGDPFDELHNGAGYRVWQRLFSRNDGHPISHF